MACPLYAAEYHVSVKGSDAGDGSASRPFKTISAAAAVAQAGDVITVHAGTYRERVNPPRGGLSDSGRIVYRAAEGEKAVIKGSEVVTGWKPVRDGVWKVTLPKAFFGDYNPYADTIVGDWFNDNGRPHHTGQVYLNGKSFFEKANLDDVLEKKDGAGAKGKNQRLYTWYCESDGRTTTIWADFRGHNPNDELVEINVRPSCFYPDAPGRDYITVRGFRMSQAATQWAAPTAEQVGLVGTHWSKGWVIENNVISDSRCTGITLGKDRKTGHNVCLKDPSKDGSVHYNEVIRRALAIGWSKETIGSHVVRNNTIFDCEQAGICGSLGAVFSEISGNHIFDIWTKRQFSGAEIAGIKIHGAIDAVIRNNRIHNTGRGIWLDWMAQGTRVTGNLCYDNSKMDLFSEVNHGPYLVDNNIFLSKTALMNMSHGGAYAHNLVAGLTSSRTTGRKTPYHKQHSTEVAGLHDLEKVGDVRFYNNIFVGDPTAAAGTGDRKKGHGLAVYNDAELAMQIDGNVYLNAASPYAGEANCVVEAGFDPDIKLLESKKQAVVRLHLTLPRSRKAAPNKPVTTRLLGRAAISGLPYVNRDDTPIKVDTDYFGAKRSDKNPAAGPFENPPQQRCVLDVWPAGTARGCSR
jgi:hypothetical protein